MLSPPAALCLDVMADAEGIFFETGNLGIFEFLVEICLVPVFRILFWVIN